MSDGRRPLTFGSLFAGIGGFDLGFVRAGLECRWQVERDPLCLQTLEAHFPDARRYRDAREFPDPGVERVDLIAAGFPCQDISRAGPRRGIDSGEAGWRDVARSVRDLRPRFIVLENSPSLALRGMGDVLGALSALGYDAEWQCLPACAFGALHIRQRLFIIAYSRRDGREASGRERAKGIPALAPGRVAPRMDPVRLLRRVDLHDPRETRFGMRLSPGGGVGIRRSVLAIPHEWEAQSPVCRVAHGFPGRVGQIRAYGNAVVPQVAEWIARRILEFDGREGR